MRTQPEGNRKNTATENRLPRRDFLRLGAALPLTLAATGTSAGWTAPPLLAPTAPLPTTHPVFIGAPVAIAPALPLAIGFWAHDGSPFSPGISPQSLSEGDSYFEQCGVCLTVNGTCSGDLTQRLALFLNFYPDEMNGAAIPVLGWAAGAMQRESGSVVANQAGSTRMQITICPNGTLSIVAEFSGTAYPLSLSTRNPRGVAKLQTGTYIIAASNTATEQLPNLSQWAWIRAAEENSPGRLVSLNKTGRSTVSAKVIAAAAPTFPYLALTVDYGTLVLPDTVS